MRRKKASTIVVAGFIAVLVVLIYLTPFAGNLVENTRFEGMLQAYTPEPNRMDIQQFVDDKTIPIPLINSSFHAPQEQGIYYYSISAYWTMDDGKFFKGDTSSVFVIEVR